MTVIPGTFIGNTFRLDPGFAWLGFPSNDGKTHTLTAIPPLLQTITISGSPPAKLFQVCRSNVIGIALNPAE
jgi:hypothetical protein